MEESYIRCIVINTPCMGSFWTMSDILMMLCIILGLLNKTQGLNMQLSTSMNVLHLYVKLICRTKKSIIIGPLSWVSKINCLMVVHGNAQMLFMT